MVNANTKGRNAENRLSTWFTVHGYPNELIRLQGINNAGDLWLPYEHARVEIKNHANILNAINEATHEIDRLRTVFPDDACWAVTARAGLPPERWYATRLVEHVWPKR